MMTELQGKTVLLVEDEHLVARMAADMLEDLGAIVVGPASRIPEGLAMAESARLDAAVLDVNIRGERSAAIAAALKERKIPFVVSTGYSRDDIGPLDDAVMLSKPFTADKLGAALVRAMTRGG